MFYLGIDQHARQITISLRDDSGDVLQARQVSTQPEKVNAFFQQLTRERLHDRESFVAVLEPGQASAPHRHPGPVFGYVLEGEYEWAIDDGKPKVLKTGDTFYEPTGCLHRVSKNPSDKNRTRVLAVVLHPHDAKQISTPEPRK